MERWSGMVAVVTGASSGIGACLAKKLAEAGMVTIGLARQVHLVEALRDQLPPDQSARLHAIRCDVSKEEEISSAFQAIEQQFGGIDVLIYNAGVVRHTQLLQDDVPGEGSQPLPDILDINVLGLTLCTRKAFQSMRKRLVAGHIIHINSVGGHKTLNMPHANMYIPSKHTFTSLTETIRNELREMGSKIKITSISPGVIETEITAGLGDHQDLPMLQPEDIASAVLFVLGTPEHVQVYEMNIKAVGEVF